LLIFKHLKEIFTIKVQDMYVKYMRKIKKGLGNAKRMVAWSSGRREEAIHSRLIQNYVLHGHKCPFPDGLKAMLPPTKKQPAGAIPTGCDFPQDYYED